MIFKPKSEDDIIKGLSCLTQKELNTLMLDASWDGRLSIIKMLLSIGVDVNAKNEANSSPLMWASVYGNLDVVKMLLDAGAEVNVKNNFGNTVLNYAGDKNNIIKLLKQYGAK